MRVAWDLQAVTGPGRTGLGVSVQFLLDALRTQAPEVEVVELRPNDRNAALAGVPDRLMWEQWRLPAALRAAQRVRPLDLAYSPALGAPLVSPVPVVTHVHDLIPLHYPQQFSGLASRWYWRSLLPLTWRRSSALTVSNPAVAEDIADHLGYDAERIHVVPYYPDPTVAAAAREIDPGFAEIEEEPESEIPVFVTMASHEWRKNIEAPIAALGLLKNRGIPARLVCVGGHSARTDSYRDAAQRAGVADQVEFPGYLDRRATVRLLLSCTALVFMSHYEGYGMPPQEAQSIGGAVVLSDITCHRRVYHDEKRWSLVAEDLREPPPLLPPDDHGALADTLERLIGDSAYRCRLRRSGLAYSQTFSPVETAAGLLQAFRSARATPRGG